ncbi:MAG TPA: A24 family peptidase [Candidatus Binatia bacterium]|nr:A24 family peptidase [Candidatus Binatia bacterium]
MAEISPGVVAAVTFLFGAVLGSFLNVCIYRLPLHESIVFPASHCRACSTPLTWYDNLPLASYLLRRGRCRFCGASFSFRYFLVELLTALLAVALVYRFGLTVTTAGYFIFSAALVVITFIDLDHQIIPDVVSLPGAAAGVVFSLVSPALSLWNSLIGLVIGAGVLLAVALSYRALTGREGMGGGDVKLLAMIGAFLGWLAVPFTLFAASFIGSVVGVTAMVRNNADSKLALPFGPFLSFGALCYLFFGEQLIEWYLNLL